MMQRNANDGRLQLVFCTMLTVLVSAWFADGLSTVKTCMAISGKERFFSLIQNSSSEGKQKNADDSNAETTAVDKCAVHDCLPANERRCDGNQWNRTVHLLNATEFCDLLKAEKEAVTAGMPPDKWCIIAMFFAPTCPFSARLAPAFNLLPHAFPCLHVVAVDATQYSRLNLIYGVAGTPTVILFHNAKPVTRYDMEMLNFELLAQFIEANTNLRRIPVEDSETKQQGPLPTEPLRPLDYNLFCCWIFIIVCTCYYAAKSEFPKRSWQMLKRLLHTPPVLHRD